MSSPSLAKLAPKGTRWHLLAVSVFAAAGFVASLVLLRANLWSTVLVIGLLCAWTGCIAGVMNATFHGFGEFRLPYPQYLWVRLGGAAAGVGTCLAPLGLVWRLRPLQVQVDLVWLRSALGIAGLIATPFLASLLWGLLVDVPKSRASRSDRPA